MTFTEGLDRLASAKAQLIVMFFLSLAKDSISSLGSSTGTRSPKPPAAPKARRKNFSLLVLIVALCSSNSMQFLRISSSVSVAKSSSPLDNAPTGESMSWHRREHNIAARSTLELLLLMRCMVPLNVQIFVLETGDRKATLGDTVSP